MKRTISLTLLVLLVISLFSGCTEGGSNTEPAKQHTLSVGFGRTDITPTESVPLAGYGNTSRRMSTTASDPLYATCVAMTDDENNTVLLFHLDLTNSYSSAIPGIRISVSRAVDIPGENVQVAATHNHSAPDLSNPLPSIERYIAYLKDQMIAAAKAALADRKPATMHIGSVYPEGLNFVRHYYLSNATSFGDNHGWRDDTVIIGHTTEADNQLQMLKFVREGAKDVVMVNWQSHPHRGGGSSNTKITSDIVGSMRDLVEEQLGCNFAYFTGASGNVNPSSRISDENITADYIEQGKALGKYVVDAYQTAFRQVQVGKVQVSTATHTAKVNHTQDHLLEVATQIQQVWKANSNNAECSTMGRPHGIHSPYHAGAIVTKAGLGETYDIPIAAFSIGDVGFVSAPYEMFDTNGKQIKEGSPNRPW